MTQTVLSVLLVEPFSFLYFIRYKRQNDPDQFQLSFLVALFLIYNRYPVLLIL